MLTPTPIHLSISYLTIEDIQSPAAPGFWVDEEQNRFLAACFSVKVSLQLLRVFGAHFCDWGGSPQQGGDRLMPH